MRNGRWWSRSAGAARRFTADAGCGSAREILGPLCGVVAVQQAGGLPDLDEVPVRVPHVAADLGPAVDRRRDELRSLGLPLLVAGVDVGDPQVQEDRGGVAGLVVGHGDA